MARKKKQRPSATVPTRLRRSGLDRVMVTPEGIALPITVGNRGSRFGALLLDLMFIGMLMIGTTIALVAIAGGTVDVAQKLGSSSPSARAFGALAVLWILLMFLFRNAYFLFFELGPKGATPGKRITGLRIAARDGGRLNAEMVIARNLLRDIELFLPLVLLASVGWDSGAAWLAATAWFLLFALMPLFNRDALRAGDIIAGTWVVEAPSRKLQPAMSAQPAVEPAPASGRPAFVFTDEELDVYGEFELQTLERVLRDGKGQSFDAVYEAISNKISRADGWGRERAFLEAYYTQLRARLEAGMRMGYRKADKHSEKAR